LFEGTSPYNTKITKNILEAILFIKPCLSYARNAWQRLGTMPTEEAMQNYINIVDELFPSWASGSPLVTSNFLI
jgi:hypothetical protein